MKPSNLAPRPWASGALAALLLGASGCLYETSSVVKIPALQTSYPVSASPHYVDAHGDVVRDTDYEVVDRFEFEQTVKSPRHDASETTLHLEADLDRIVQRARGEAVTRLTIDAVSYDPGSQDSAAIWKIMGWSIAPLGVLITGVGIGVTEQKVAGAHPAALYGMGGAVLGVSALCFVLGAVLRSPAQWQYRVSGQVVRRPLALPSSPPPPATATSTATPAPGVAPAEPATPAPPVPSAVPATSASPPAAAPKAGATQAPPPPPPPTTPPKKRVLD